MPRSIYKGPDGPLTDNGQRLSELIGFRIEELMRIANVSGVSLREVADLIGAEARQQANRQILANRHGILKNPG